MTEQYDEQIIQPPALAVPEIDLPVGDSMELDFLGDEASRHSFLSKVREVATTAGGDFKEASLPVKALFIGSVLTVGVHLLGAETIYSRIGTNELTHVLTYEPNDFFNIFKVGARIAFASAVIETASTLAVSSCVAKFRNTTELLKGFYDQEGGEDDDPTEEHTYNQKLTNALVETKGLLDDPTELVADLTLDEYKASLEGMNKRQLKKEAKKLLRAEMKPTRKLFKNETDQTDRAEAAEKLQSLKALQKTKKGKSTKFMEGSTIALAAGSPGLILDEYAKNPNKTFLQNIKTGAKAIAGLAGLNFIVGSGIAALAKYSHDISETTQKIVLKGYGVTTDHFYGVIPSIDVVSVLRTPLFWFGLFVAGRLAINADKKEDKAIADVIVINSKRRRVLPFADEESQGGYDVA